MARIYWKDYERKLVIERAASLLHSGKAVRFGHQLFIRAQSEVLPKSRCRAELSLKSAYMEFKDEVLAQLSLLDSTALSPKVSPEVSSEVTQEPAEEVSHKGTSEATREVTPEVLQKSTGQAVESLMSLAVDSLAAEFKAMLRKSLLGTVAEVIEEANEAMLAASSHLPANGKIRVMVEPVAQEPAEPAVQTVEEVCKPNKIRGAIIGGNGKGSDRNQLNKEFGDVYDLRFIDTKKSIAGQLQGCQFAIVRTPYTSHAMQNGAISALGRSNVFTVTRGSVGAIREVLLDYLEKATSAAAEKTA